MMTQVNKPLALELLSSFDVDALKKGFESVDLQNPWVLYKKNLLVVESCSVFQSAQVAYVLNKLDVKCKSVRLSQSEYEKVSKLLKV